MYALVDCNNFFASCERVFNPALNHRPVVVLSNNDGCIIARSNEAKALGIPMGAPFFKVRDLIEKFQVAVFSSNFELYGDMSDRVMNTLAGFVPDIEIYSIDEAFLDLSLRPVDQLESDARDMRVAVGRATGIPVSIGMAPTKVLAKMASLVAKKERADNVCLLADPAACEAVLRRMPVEEIWGIGHQMSHALRAMGIGTAWELAQADSRMIRHYFSVTGQRIQWELQGIPCMGLEHAVNKKNITVSRSFRHPVESLPELEEAVSSYISRAAEKLRGQQSLARHVQVYVRTNRFNPRERHYRNAMVASLSRPTNHTPDLIFAAKEALKTIYISGLRYQKAGIMLLDLMPESARQDGLFSDPQPPAQASLMQAVDAVNARFGHRSLYYGATGFEQSWQMASDRRSPRYTTDWADLPIVR